MRIEANTKTFADAVKEAAIFSGQGKLIQIFDNILIETRGGDGIVLSCTNAIAGIRRFLKVDVLEEGATTVPAGRLSKWLNGQSAEQIKMEKKPDDGRATIRAGRSRSTMLTIPTGEFPPFPDPDSLQLIFEVDTDDFRAGLKRVVHAASTETYRESLAGVHLFTLRDHLVLEAADGYRLSRTKVNGKVMLSNRNTIVPIEVVRKLMSVASLHSGITKMSLSENHICLEFSDGTIVMASVLSGAYPDVDQLITEKFKITALVVVDDLLASLRRAELFSEMAKIRFGIVDDAPIDDLGEIEITSQGQETGSGTESFDCTVIGKDGLTFGVSSKFLVDVCKSVNVQEIAFGLNGELDPIHIFDGSPEDADTLHIIMPMRFD